MYFFLLACFCLCLLQSSGNILLWNSALKNLQTSMQPCCLPPELGDATVSQFAAGQLYWQGGCPCSPSWGWLVWLLWKKFLSCSQYFLWLRTAVGFAVPCPFEFPVLVSLFLCGFRRRASQFQARGEPAEFCRVAAAQVLCLSGLPPWGTPVVGIRDTVKLVLS